MRVRLWGTRGSLPSAGPETVRYGGNTSCVEVRARADTTIVLDAGSGVRRLGDHLEPGERVDVLLTHLHIDHIMGLGFFAPLFVPGLEVHIWGPSSPLHDLRARLGRYLNPPLLPVRIPDLPCDLVLHDVPRGRFEIPGVEVTADLICHPAPAVGYRLDDGTGTLAYLPDHEPALGVRDFPQARKWTSGSDLAADVDVLIHDAQYTRDEYRTKAGWGHSTLTDAVVFAELIGARRLVGFHHDPAHSDDELDVLWDVATWERQPGIPVAPAREGMTIEIGTGTA